MLRLITLSSLTVLAIATIARADIIWDNGTHVPGGTTGASFGWNQTASTPFRFSLADDFTVSGVAVLTHFSTIGYMPGNTVNQPQVRAVYVQIREDNAGAPGNVIFGDLVNGVPFGETFTGEFRGTGTANPLYRVETALPGWTLCSGRYWIEYNVDQNDIRPQTGAANANYISPPLSPVPPGANALQRNVLTDTWFVTNNAFEFVIEGTLLPACPSPGDFDHDGACTPADVPPLVAALLTGDPSTCADINGDCRVDGDDLAPFIACLAN